MKISYSMFTINQGKTSFSTREYQYWIVLSGNGEISSKNETFLLESHDVLEIPFDKTFEFNCNVPMHIGCITLTEFTSNNTYFQKKEHSDTELLRKTFFFAMEVQGLPSAENKNIKYYLNQMMWEALVNSGMKTYRINPGIKAALEDIKDHAFEPDYDVNQAITASGYSQSYFHKLFHETTGVSPVEFVQMQRVDYAKTLLQQSNRPSIKEIAQMCAFSDAYYFSRVFKKVTGVAPREYALGK